MEMKNIMETDMETDLETEAEREIELKPIDRYLPYLIKSFPNPLNQTELAELSGVSKAAVSKNRDYLAKISNINTLAFDRKYVLSTDTDIALNLFFYCLAHDDIKYIRTYLTSQYLDTLFNEINPYVLLSDKLKDYSFSMFFSKEDIDWIKKFIILKIKMYKDIDDKDDEQLIVIPLRDEIDEFAIRLTQKIPERMNYFLKIIFFNGLSVLKAEEDFYKLLELRDKTFRFLEYNSKHIVPHIIKLVDWLEIDNTNEQEAYKDFIIKILISFVKKIFKLSTKYIIKEAEKQQVIIDKEYNKLGAIWYLKKN